MAWTPSGKHPHNLPFLLGYTDSGRGWDEKKVADWLRSIRCGHYEQLFRTNHFTGANLLECDQKILQEMGIKKIGDRVRIFVAIKQLRTKAGVGRSRRRSKDSIAGLDPQIYTPSSTESARALNARNQPGASRRWSRLDTLGIGRPGSPYAESYAYAASPNDTPRKDGHSNHHSPANPTTGRRSDRNPGAQGMAIHRQTASGDVTTRSALGNTSMIRMIHEKGQTKVLNIQMCKTAEDVTIMVLKKLKIPESLHRNYCFWVLDGLEPNPANCRRLSDTELMNICDTNNRSERGRLILRKIHAGEPDRDELEEAAKLAVKEAQAQHTEAMKFNVGSKSRVQQRMGEDWESMQQPISPASAFNRYTHAPTSADDWETPNTPVYKDDNLRNRTNKLRPFFDLRPPSEMIVQELTSYFPSSKKEEIEKTMRLSARRSQRMSRVQSRLSVMSNSSYTSSLRDAPPIPNIADQWLSQSNQGRVARPLSVSKFALPNTAFRDSMASTLQPLQEESSEANRKSYVSFDSGSDSAQHDVARQSFFEESPIVPGTESSNVVQRLSMIAAEDGEEDDHELNQFLAGGNTFEKGSWVKGDLIGEGTFGSVYLALHSITGELMAVKQVELPEVARGTEIDKRKNSMITALKQEIDLLQGLQHQNIVQYLGTSSDDENLNIFLEYVPGGSIAFMLQRWNTFKEPLIRSFVRQILQGLAYLHGRNIIHRDIKGANVLVDNKGGVKISDFGISKRVEASMLNRGPGGANRPSLQGSVFWMAPEVVRQSTHTKKADIWSLGCLIVEMFTGAHPFPDHSQMQAIFAIGSASAKPDIPTQASAEGKKFLAMTFETDHEKRPSAEQLLKEKFLNPIA